MRLELFEIYRMHLKSQDRELLQRFCSQFADTRVFVPCASESIRRSRVLHFSYKGQIAVPVFSSENRFRRWSNEHGDFAEPIRIGAGDLALVLEPEVGLVLDPTYPMQLDIPAKHLAMIADHAFGMQQLGNL